MEDHVKGRLIKNHIFKGIMMLFVFVSLLPLLLILY